VAGLGVSALERQGPLWQDLVSQLEDAGLAANEKGLRGAHGTMTVIPFRDRGAARPPRRPVEPPPALGKPASDPGEGGDDAEFYRLRARQNWAVLVLVIVLVLGGAWLIERLAAFSRALACYEFGHRNCMPLKIDMPPR